MKKILVIGGSYFFGRYFVMLAAKLGYEITVLNRGNVDMSAWAGRQIICDRRNQEKLSGLLHGEFFDAVIDFCAFEPGDIRILFEILPCGWERYIYISSASVYVQHPGVRSESSPLYRENPGGAGGDFAIRKRILEEELIWCADKYGGAYTIFRPAYIYGPFNYLGREDWYFKFLTENGFIIIPLDADGQFQLVYVHDAAWAVSRSISMAGNGIYNLSAPEVMDYRKWSSVLQQAIPGKVPVHGMTLQEINAAGIALPYPVTHAQNILISGKLAQESLSFDYTDIVTGIRESYAFYMKNTGRRLQHKQDKGIGG